MVNVKINGISISVEEGTTILQAAQRAGVEIPTLCHLPEVNEIGACRVCVVEVEGHDRLAAACNSPVIDGMIVHTNSKRARKARRMNMHFMLSQHRSYCPTCVRSGNCQLQSLSSQMNILGEMFNAEFAENRWDTSLPIIRKEAKCIKCMRCVQVCDKVQNMNVWDVSGTGSRTTIDVSQNRDFSDSNCTYCGQCVTHCPVGALIERDDTDELLAQLDDPEVITVVQVAPAVRAAWAEGLDTDREYASPGRLAAALRRIGFDYVFDTNFAADLTIMEEGSEFIERFTNRQKSAMPLFTSCCPGWVSFVKSEFPEFRDNLSTAKSPQQMFGAVTKSYFAERIGVDPHKIYCVSIMPCTSKKAECDLPQMNDACGDKDVDAVLTTREFVRMLKMLSIDLTKLPEEEFDSPLGSGTGAAVIFGATGGVMDAALRSAYYLITGETPGADAFKCVRGMDGWKQATFEVPGAGEVKTAVVSGLGNARKLMNAIKDGKAQYDFVEVMACPGGCAGGGGQPIVHNTEMAEVRGDHLWRLDRESNIRYSHENADVIAMYEDYFEKPLSHKSHKLLHTDHSL